MHHTIRAGTKDITAKEWVERVPCHNKDQARCLSTRECKALVVQTNLVSLIRVLARVR